MPRKKKTETPVDAKEKKVKPKKTSTKIEKKPKKKAAPQPADAGDQVGPTIPSEEKMQVIRDFQVKEGDTGSPEVQIALLTSRIGKLVTHLKINPSDNHSRRGLLGIVSKRRRLLNYLEEQDGGRHKAVSKRLGLSK